MTDWAPDVSAMTPDRYLLLEFVKLCKKYRVEADAWNSALSLASVENLPVAEYMLDKKKDAVSEAQQHADAAFRRLETALIDGSDFREFLQKLLGRHL